MSKLTRQTMLLFAQNAGADQIEQFGSLANGSPNYLNPVAASIPTIQALSNYLEGWFGGVVGSNLPAIEDVNALAFLYAYQLVYLFQAGIPEWDAGTTYFTGSISQVAGEAYVSLQDTNLNHLTTDTAWWEPAFLTQTNRTVFTTNGNFVVPTNVKRLRLLAQSNGNGGLKAQIVNSSTSSIEFIDTTGQMWGLGYDTNGIPLGDGGSGGPFGISSPIAVFGGIKWAKIWNQDEVIGSWFAKDDKGATWSWGGGGPQLGIGILSGGSSTPVQVLAAPGSKFKKVFVDATVIALDGYRDIYTWGSNAMDLLGVGTDVGSLPSQSTPTLVIGGHKYQNMFFNNPSNPDGYGVCKQIFGLDMSGNLWAWGSNLHGVCGTNQTVTNCSSPTLVVGGQVWTQFNELFTWGNPLASAIDSLGHLYTWGSNANGQLGIGADPSVTLAVSSPVLVVGGLTWKNAMKTLAKAVIANVTNPLTAFGAIDSLGRAWVWGQNQSGLGNGISPVSVAAYSSPVQVAGGNTWSQLYTFADLFWGSGQSFWGIDTAGLLWAWGSNAATGWLGVGNGTTDYSSPIQVIFPAGVGKIQKLRATNAGSGNTRFTLFAEDDKGQIFTWGSNEGGLLGANIPNASNGTPIQSSPVMVLGGPWQKLYLDYTGGRAYATDCIGNTWSWGSNDGGELGLGDTVDTHSSPTLMIGLKDVSLLEKQQYLDIDVVPGASYAVVVQGFYANFGFINVGTNVDQLTVEWLQ